MLKVATEIVDIFYPVGSCYMTTDSTYNPNTKMGGTWEQITSDAYLKIVSSNAGSLGGTSSEHKIPIESMPKHSHTATVYQIESGSQSATAARLTYKDSTTTAWVSEGLSWIDSTGGGEAYYPYYLGIYLWHRTA